MIDDQDRARSRVDDSHYSANGGNHRSKSEKVRAEIGIRSFSRKLLESQLPATLDPVLRHLGAQRRLLEAQGVGCLALIAVAAAQRALDARPLVGVLLVLQLARAVGD